MSLDSSQLSHSPLSGAEPLDMPQRLSQYVEPASQAVVIPDSPTSSQAPTQLQDSGDVLDDSVIELTPPSSQDVIPESPPLSLDEQRAANMARNVSVARALGLRPRPESPVKQPAHRNRASWKCTPQCGQSFTKSEDLVNHLREVHQKEQCLRSCSHWLWSVPLLSWDLLCTAGMAQSCCELQSSPQTSHRDFPSPASSIMPSMV